MDNVIIELPNGVENLQLPDPNLITYYQEENDRRIWLETEITPELTLEIAKKIFLWNKEDIGKPVEERKPIRLYFFSPGGDLATSNAVIDAIKLSKTPVWGINVGECASGAAFIFIACHKRFTTKRSYFLFHQGSGAFSGSFSEVCYQIQDYQTQVDLLTDYMVENTKYTKEEVADNIGNEWYIYPQEAVEHGVCDSIVTNIDEVL